MSLFFLIYAYADMYAGKNATRSLVEAEEEIMSEDSIHNIITIVVLVLLFSWVPLVNVFRPPGWRRLTKELSTEEKAQTTPRQEQATPHAVSRPAILTQTQAPAKSSASRKEIMKTCAE